MKVLMVEDNSGDVGLVRRSLETRQGMVAEPKRLLEVLEADREAREIGIAEIVVHAAGCQDAHVVAGRDVGEQLRVCRPGSQRAVRRGALDGGRPLGER